MGRATIPVEKSILTSIIQEVEQEDSPKNRSELFEIAARKYNSHPQTNYPIKPQLIYLRVKEWNIELVTPKGKKISEVRTNTTKISRREKFKQNTATTKSLQQIRSKTPSKYLPIVDKIEDGSLTAAVKLHCLECSGYAKAEIRNCLCNTCPLYPFRPYQGNSDVD